MKNYLNFESEIKNIENEIEKLKDPFNKDWEVAVAMEISAKGSRFKVSKNMTKLTTDRSKQN